MSLDKYIDYFDGTINSPALRNVNIRYLDGTGAIQGQHRDLANGRHLQYGNIGLQYEGDFDGWLVALKSGYTKGTLGFDAFYSTSNPVDANSYLTPTRAAFGASVDHLGYAIAGTNGAHVYNPAADSGLVMQAQYRAIDSDFYSGQGDLSVTRKFETGFGSHDIKAGFYGSAYGETLFSAFQDYLVQVKASRPRSNC